MKRFPTGVLSRCRLFLAQHPLRHHIPLTPVLLALLWCYVTYWGEYSSSAASVASCQWGKWEHWPAHARPHHLVFVADPQLVDPHTYPGRPWPLSKLTEVYTDRYMARNFRMINSQLDPDSVVFLGDLLDGGREWAPIPKSVWVPPPPAEAEPTSESAPSEGGEAGAQVETRSEHNLQKAGNPDQSDHTIQKREEAPTGKDEHLTEFVAGENGRWRAWGQRQWDSEYARLGRIFFDEGQLYPEADRRLLVMSEEPLDAVAIANGAKQLTREHFAVHGPKSRQVIAGLPGNHDLGFGERVQLVVRDRFEGRFGSTNRVNVLGNHTIISLDTPSLSAFGQWLPEGGETSLERAAQLEHIWRPTMDFMDNITIPVNKVIRNALSELDTTHQPQQGLQHEVLSTEDYHNSGSAEQAGSWVPPLPVILLTHVPLYRDPDVDCGQQRERGRAIPISAGYQYQNVVIRPLSNTIMGKISAAGDVVHIFSGDDHDYCDMTHRYNVAGHSKAKNSLPITVPEITVKSFSWAMGVRKPGFQLVSLWNPVDSHGERIGESLPTVQTQLCLLPDQLSIFINYALLFGLTIVVLLIRAVWIGWHWTGAQVEQPIYAALKMGLPQFESYSNGSANGYASPKKMETLVKGRQRGSSTSMSHSNGHDRGHLSVQRSFNARTRSVSPAAGLGYALPDWRRSSPGPPSDRDDHYTEVKWHDPDESDEESRIGDEDDNGHEKWRRKRKGKTRVRAALDALLYSIAQTGIPAVIWYAWMLHIG